jgi:hypothetical protein
VFNKKRDEEDQPGFDTNEEDVRLLDRQEEEEEIPKNDTAAILNVQQETSSTGLASRFPITVKRDGARRFCQKCNVEKFDRTHHCRMCKRYFWIYKEKISILNDDIYRCVLKMDQ